jgi:putative acetyltransferase
MIHYEHTDFSNPDFKHFCEELDREFVVRYPYLQNVFTSVNTLSDNARVVLAYDGVRCVACGAFRPVSDQLVEIKRMYTLPEYRNKGVGKMLLAELETWARNEGFIESILETGIRQPEAIAAYEKSGYVRIPNFPPYEQVKESICYHKEL